MRETDLVIDLRRASTRNVSTDIGRTTSHSFSFGEHYDPDNVGFGALVCHNDDLVQPGHGYADHPHVNLEIVTWVLAGALTHADTSGTHTLGAGHAQVLSAGSGVRHSETVDIGAGPTRFVQTWVRPDAADTVPSYLTEALTLGDGFTEVAGPSSLPLGTAGASLSVARLSAGEGLLVPAQRQAHLFVATGQVALGLDVLTEADAARLTESGALELTCLEDAELMMWSFSPPTR